MQQDELCVEVPTSATHPLMQTIAMPDVPVASAGVSTFVDVNDAAGALQITVNGAAFFRDGNVDGATPCRHTVRFLVSVVYMLTLCSRSIHQNLPVQ